MLGTPLAPSIAKKLRVKGAHLETVALCDVEFISGIRSALLRKELSLARAAEAIEDYSDLPLRLHPHRPFLERLWELRNNFTAYDAAYVVLAERLNAALLTADERLARSVLSHTSIRLIEIA